MEAFLKGVASWAKNYRTLCGFKLHQLPRMFGSHSLQGVKAKDFLLGGRWYCYLRILPHMLLSPNKNKHMDLWYRRCLMIVSRVEHFLYKTYLICMHIWCVLHINAYVLLIMCKQEHIIHAKNMATVWNHITLVTEVLWPSICVLFDIIMVSFVSLSRTKNCLDRFVSTAKVKIQQKYTEKFDPWIIQRLIFNHEHSLEPGWSKIV